VLEDVELQLDDVVGVNLKTTGSTKDQPSGWTPPASPSLGSQLTQYLVVCRTKAFWLPPAPESPSTG